MKYGIADEEQILIELSRLDLAWIVSGLLLVAVELDEGDAAEKVADLASTILKVTLEDA